MASSSNCANKVIVIGNLGANPTIRIIGDSGRSVANFSLATTQRFDDRNSARQERTQWHRIVASDGWPSPWRRAAFAVRSE
jgi:single stranded DNA-binding protein